MTGDYRTDDGTAVQAKLDPDGLVSLSVEEHGPAVELQLIDAALGTGLRLEHATRETTLSISRQRIVVLVFDLLRHVFIQSARVELGREMLLLVENDLSERVRVALGQSAEEGFNLVSSEVHGLSADWTLFSDVRLHSVPTFAGEELQALQPLSQTQVELEGGLQLTDGRWHSKAPPSVIAVDGHDRSFVVVLHNQSNLDQEPLDLGEHAGQARISLTDRGLPDGDYRIVLTEVGGAEITSRAIKLRSSSSEHLDPPVPRIQQLAYVTEPAIAPRAALSADPYADSATGVLRGAVIEQRSGLRAVPRTKLGQELGNIEPVETIEAWVRRYSGATREVDLEQARTYLRLGFVGHENGELVRTIAGTLHMHKVRPRSRPTQRQSGSSTSSSHGLGVDLDLVLDALAVMKTGSWNAFRRLIDHSDTERFVPHEAIRTLRALALVDVEVERRDASPRRWSLSPTALLALPHRNSAVLTGRRNSELIEHLQEAASTANAHFDQGEGDGRPMRITIDGEHRGVLQEIADVLAIPLILDAPRRILERMPTIHDILAAQPELLVPEGCSFERFDRATNNWDSTEASDARLAGAYRIRFPTGEQRYAVWADGVWRECGNATAKYAGAAAVGEHIMAYDEERQELTCLFGARPPGLFERALVLCSGELPHQPGDHRWIYCNVPDNVHRWIAAKLGPAGWRR